MSLQDTLSLKWLIEILSFVMLVLALWIVLLPNLLSIIRLYQAQSVILAIITPIVAAAFGHWIVLFFIFIPIMLALFVEPLLALATVGEDMPTIQRFFRLVRGQLLRPTVLARIRSRALPTWLELRPSRRGQIFPFFTSLVLVAFAYLLAFSLVSDFPGTLDVAKEEFIQANGIAVSLSLVLLGLTILTQKQDIISQIMGLLVMEHGLFLFAIKVPGAYLSTTVGFVVSLFVYITITLIILAVLLPELYSRSESIEIDDQEELKG